MKVIFSKQFKKQYRNLSPQLQQQAKNRIELWKDNPNDPIIRLHKLKGKLAHLYSINITGDIRAIYEATDDEVYIYQMIGSHSQLYR